MTSLAIDQSQVDLALAARYAGIQVPVGTPPSLTPVRVFIETPDNEEVPERVFPSVSIMFASSVPAFTHYESEDFNEEERVLDTGPTPPVRTMRERPLPYNLLYMVHSWFKARAAGDRELVKRVFVERTKPRTYLNAENIDFEPIELDMYTQGSLA